MLGQHPELYGFPELLLLTKRTIGEILDGDHDLDAAWRLHHQAGLVRAVAEVVIGERAGKDAIAQAREWLERHRGWPTVAVFDLLQEKVNPRVAVEKTPETSSSETPIFRSLIAYPRARFIHLVRHPVSTIRSMCEHWRTRDWIANRGPLEVTCAATWYASHRRLLRILSEFASERTLRVKAEAVLNDPERELPRIAQWLDLATDDEAIEAMLHPEHSPYARFGPPEAPGGHDPKFLRNPIPRPVAVPGSIEFPAQWQIGSQATAAIAELAGELGY